MEEPILDGLSEALSITTSYDYDAPIDEYGLIRQPKYGHLKELHRSIKLCERALVSADLTVTSLGTYQQVVHFKGSRKRLMLESWNFYNSSASPGISDMLCLILMSGRKKYDI